MGVAARQAQRADTAEGPRVLSPTPWGGVRAKWGSPRAQAENRAGNGSPAQRSKDGHGEGRQPSKDRKADATRNMSERWIGGLRTCRKYNKRGASAVVWGRGEGGEGRIPQGCWDEH